MPPASNPQVAVGGVVLDPRGARGRAVVLVKRAHPPRPGRWSLPGGRVEPGERLADAVAREVREETGLDVRVGPLIEVVEILDPPYHYVILDYLCAPIGGALRPGDDAADVALCALDDLEPYELSEAALRVIRRGARLRWPGRR